MELNANNKYGLFEIPKMFILKVLNVGRVSLVSAKNFADAFMRCVTNVEPCQGICCQEIPGLMTAPAYHLKNICNVIT
jgi:hypothetical protein